MSVQFKDNSKEILDLLKTNEGRALTAIGMEAVELVVKKMYHPNEGKEIYDTGNLIGDVNYKVRMNDLEVDIGNTLRYAIWVHEGTENEDGSVRMAARPYLKDALTENTQVWKELAEEHLGAGFSGHYTGYKANK